MLARRSACEPGLSAGSALDAERRRVQRSNMGAIKSRQGLRLAVAAALVSMLTANALALAEGPGSTPGQAGEPPARTRCFLLREWSGLWKVTPDSRTMYIRAAGRVYRLDLATAYPLLKSPWAVVSYRDSSNTICSALDLRLVVTDRLGAFYQIIVKKMTLLTPAEAATLPKSLQPSTLYPRIS